MSAPTHKCLLHGPLLHVLAFTDTRAKKWVGQFRNNSFLIYLQYINR